MSVIEKLKIENPNEHDTYKLITYDILQARFEYLNACINETLRIDPPGIFVERTAGKDIELTNSDGSIAISFKKNDVVHIPVWSLHRMEQYFSEPEVFKPERFLSDNGEASINKYAYMPFGNGMLFFIF